jgi:hypothetical protein
MRHGVPMGTKLTFQGVETTVELEDHAITLRGASAETGGEAPAGGDPAGAEPVVIPRWEVESATIKSASLLAYGKLVIAVRGGQEHTVEFSRDAQDRFSDLAAIIG